MIYQSYFILDFSYLGNGLAGIHIDIKRSHVSHVSDKFLFHPPRNAMTHRYTVELTAKPTFFRVELDNNLRQH